ncbi:hypothetical protein OC498_13710 [Acinetobacter bohemicus]|uniref:PDZ domain-containing protein n=1 Tax=Acinetobacter TaxID=469 RepID=UPI00209BB38D|nr:MULTISPECIES: hypothetical protein [Acinetobacter]MCO8043677.1 hypothetical protein [Acinetobacter sp. S4400-12]MCU7225930.1 hypothetical protein [Acinetobacter bohemicus]
MSSTKIKLIGFLTLMGCVTADAGNNFSILNEYKTPDGGIILTTRKINKPGYELLKVTDLSAPPTATRKSSANTTNRKIDEPEDKRQPLIIHAANGPIIETRTLSNNSVSTSNVSKPTSNNSVDTSNVSKFYNSVDWREDEKQNSEYLKPGEQVQVLEVAPGLESYKSYSAQGYKAIGQSIFRDWDVSKDSLINQAKKVGATFVTFSKYADSSITYSVKDNLNNLANTVNPKNLATIIDPNNLGIIYSYEVLFYVKDNSHKNPNAFGFTISDIPLEKRKTYQRNTGSYVETVVQGSKAYNANVLNEDVIIAINNNPILTDDDFLKIKEKELKKTKVLELKILRLVNNELKELNIPVNF